MRRPFLFGSTRTDDSPLAGLVQLHPPARSAETSVAPAFRRGGVFRKIGRRRFSGATEAALLRR